MSAEEIDQFTKNLRKKMFNLEKRMKWVQRDLEMFKKVSQVVYREKAEQNKPQQLEMFAS